jgi:Spy/CpxP family protein refolding chaperone
MYPQNKNRLIFWIMIFLVIINLSALVTFFAFGRTREDVNCNAMQGQCGKAFQCELGLSEEQLRKVDLINSDYQSASGPLVSEIRNIRSDILDELSSEVPDTALIRQKSGELCDVQLKLQQANFTQYLELKKVCDPEQAQRLSALYRELYGCAAMNKGGGRMHRYMGGH